MQFVTSACIVYTLDNGRLSSNRPGDATLRVETLREPSLGHRPRFHLPDTGSVLKLAMVMSIDPAPEQDRITMAMATMAAEAAMTETDRAWAERNDVMWVNDDIARPKDYDAEGNYIGVRS